MEREQQQRFADAVERKKAEAARKARNTSTATPGDSPVHEEIEASEIEPGRPQDTLSPRAKNERKGKVTAENWNQ